MRYSISNQCRERNTGIMWSYLDIILQIVRAAEFWTRCSFPILGDPGADSGGEGKSKRGEK